MSTGFVNSKTLLMASQDLPAPNSNIFLFRIFIRGSWEPQSIAYMTLGFRSGFHCRACWGFSLPFLCSYLVSDMKKKLSLVLTINFKISRDFSRLRALLGLAPSFTQFCQKTTKEASQQTPSWQLSTTRPRLKTTFVTIINQPEPEYLICEVCFSGYPHFHNQVSTFECQEAQTSGPEYLDEVTSCDGT